MSGYEDLEEEDLGVAGSMEGIKKGNHHSCFFTTHLTMTQPRWLSCAPTEEVANEIRRAMDDAMGVVWVAKNDGKIVPGGSAPPVRWLTTCVTMQHQ